MNKKTIKSSSENETIKIAREFARELNTGDIVLLYGDLGYGKTTFTKGIAEGLGITSRIISPTFVIVRTHKIKNQKIEVLHHIDLYRIEDKTKLEEIGINEILGNEFSIKIVEWPERMESDNLKRWEVRLTLGKTDEERTISITKYE